MAQGRGGGGGGQEISTSTKTSLHLLMLVLVARSFPVAGAPSYMFAPSYVSVLNCPNVPSYIFVRAIYSERSVLGAKGIATRSKDATRGSWPYY